MYIYIYMYIHIYTYIYIYEYAYFYMSLYILKAGVLNIERAPSQIHHMHMWGVMEPWHMHL